MASLNKSNFPKFCKKDANGSFELLGFDILIDNQLKP